MSENHIGLVGLGAMGMGMAKSLRRAGYSVHVFDIRRDTRFFYGPGLLCGWLAGMACGTAMVASLGLRTSIYPLHVAGHVYGMYAALPALALNLAVASIVSLLLKISGRAPAGDFSAER